MINCKEASELLSRAQDAPLGLRQRLALRLHLLMCAACTRFAKQMDFLREAMQRYRD